VLNKSSHLSNDEKYFGVFQADNATPVPLRGVSVEAHIDDFSAEVEVQQRYQNIEEKAIEAVYSFPLPESAAVCGFDVETDDKTIVAKVDEKEAAFEKYDESISKGWGAFLLDQDRPNIFTASIGNLLPKQSVLVKIKYVMELDSEGDGIRFFLPTTISPRYLPTKTLSESDPALIDHISPPTVAGELPYGLKLKIHVRQADKFQSFQSPSHPICIETIHNEAVISLGTETTQLNQDFVLVLRKKDPEEPSVVLAKDVDSGFVAMMNFTPQIDVLLKANRTVIFLLDCSGSMIGESIAQAQNALQICLHSLREGDRFQVIEFGSSYRSLFHSAVDYTQKNLDMAISHTQSIKADLGGTEVFSPLEHILKKESDASKAILLITDGEIGNEPEVISLVNKYRNSCHLFPVGIGRGVNQYFLKGLARSTGDFAEFIFPGERIEPKILRHFQRTRSPHFESIKLDWSPMEPIRQTPTQIDNLFSGDRLTMFARLNELIEADVHLQAKSGECTFDWQFTISPDTVQEHSAVPTLMARRLVRDLEENPASAHRGSSQSDRTDKMINQQIIELGRQYNLVNSLTSFIGIERRKAAVASTQPELRRVPIELTKNYGAVEETKMPTFIRKRMESVYRPLVIEDHDVAFDAISNLCSHTPDIPKFSRKRMASPTPSIVNENHEEMMRLIQSQKADGHWELNNDLLVISKIDTATVLTAIHEIHERLVNAKDIVATAIALKILEERFEEFESEWAFLADKARRFLEYYQIQMEDVRLG